MMGTMPGFGDYIFIFLLALILFGPKKMPELARQLGKLMGEFRRASNEFKMQMEEELRTSEVAALEAAAPPPVTLDAPAEEIVAEVPIETAATPETPAIATAGEITMRPPETGLPVAQAETAASPADAVNALADSIPAVHEGQTTHG